MPAAETAAKINFLTSAPSCSSFFSQTRIACGTLLQVSTRGFVYPDNMQEGPGWSRGTHRKGESMLHCMSSGALIPMRSLDAVLAGNRKVRICSQLLAFLQFTMQEPFRFICQLRGTQLRHCPLRWHKRERRQTTRICLTSAYKKKWLYPSHLTRHFSSYFPTQETQFLQGFKHSRILRPAALIARGAAFLAICTIRSFSSKRRT